jgi:hypothetical protein
MGIIVDAVIPSIVRQYRGAKKRLATGRFGSTAVHPLSCANRQQWVEMRHSRFVRSGEVHPSKAVINGPKPQHQTLRLL